MNTINPLQKGDKIHIVSPAGKINPDILENAVRQIENRGFMASISKNADGSYHQFSSGDAQRANDMQSALDNQEIKAILCSRGGYGTGRIIGQLDFSGFVKHPKWIIGFSDITVLHAHLNNNLCIPGIHGPMAKNFPLFPSSDISIELLFDILAGKSPGVKFQHDSLNRTGIAEGILTGGNLSLLYSLRGTPYDLKPEGKILFIEDLGEHLYHLDRMMLNLKLGGVLEKINGMIVGSFSAMKDNNPPFGKTAYEIIASYITEYDYPVAFRFPAGHTKRNTPLIFGKKVNLTVRREASNLEYVQKA